MTARWSPYGQGLGGGPAKTLVVGYGGRPGMVEPQVSSILGFRRPAAEPLAFGLRSRGRGRTGPPMTGGQRLQGTHERAALPSRQRPRAFGCGPVTSRAVGDGAGCRENLRCLKPEAHKALPCPPSPATTFSRHPAAFMTASPHGP